MIDKGLATSISKKAISSENKINNFVSHIVSIDIKEMEKILGWSLLI